ncbi:unnamed protein product [Amoebophrya sp. A120]|nr:unnamed protein product [Amoebophrya sp. A120]|eukprot:GSA120T00021109001.1
MYLSSKTFSKVPILAGTTTHALIGAAHLSAVKLKRLLALHLIGLISTGVIVSIVSSQAFLARPNYNFIRAISTVFLKIQHCCFDLISFLLSSRDAKKLNHFWTGTVSSPLSFIVVERHKKLDFVLPRIPPYPLGNFDVF